MSETVLCFVISLAILAGLALWIPTLEICNAHCRKFLTGRAERRAKQVDDADEEPSLREVA